MKVITDNDRYKRKKIIVNDIKQKQEELYQRDTWEEIFENKKTNSNLVVKE